MSRILVVEDHVMNMRLFLAVLVRRGHEVDTAADVDGALARLAVTRPDVIVLDVQIPGGGGIRVLRAVRSDPRLADVPVIAVTALAMAGDRERLLAEGFDGYVSKPIDVRTFGATIERFLPQR